MTLEERFGVKVDRRGPGECWPWRASLGTHGYGQFRLDGTITVAHRVAYLLWVGPIPAGFEVDHVHERGCRDRTCCNPAHLEAVEKAENLRRQGAAKVNCIRGHPFDEENTYITPEGWRLCRRCRRERMREHARRAREAA